MSVVSIAYWLALAAWFGSTLFVTVVAPRVHRVVREADPTLPTVLSVNLEGQHATLLGGRIVGDLLAALWRVELACLAAMGVAQGAEWLIALTGDYDLIPPLVRTALLALAGATAVYGGRVARPRASAARDEYVEHADDPDVANAALDRLDRLARDATSALNAELIVLAGLVLFAAVGLGVRGGTAFVSL